MGKASNQGGLSPNECLPPASVQITTLNAAWVGTSSAAILRFDGTPSVVGTAIAAATTAALGTVISITERGLYVAELIGANVFLDAETINFGVSLNTNAAGLVALPTLATVGMLQASAATGPTAEQSLTYAIQLSTPFAVTAALASVAGGALLRFHATAALAAVPNTITAASVRVNVRRVADWLL